MVLCEEIMNLLLSHHFPQPFVTGLERLRVVGVDLLWSASSGDETLETDDQLLEGLIRHEVQVHSSREAAAIQKNVRLPNSLG